MKCLLVFNPVAGQGRHEALPSLVSLLGPLLAEVVVTRGPGDAESAARRAAQAGAFDAVLVAGGDGTINEVVNGLLDGPPERRPSLGLIPEGTQNVLAHELKIPMGDLEALLAVIRGARTRAMDVGRASGRGFALMAGFGFDAAVVGDVRRPVKELIGPAAYVFTTLGALTKYHSTSVRLTLDGEEVTSEAFMVVIANTPSYAYRQIKLAPFAAIDDGWLDVCVFERAPGDRMGFFTQMMAVAARRHLRDPRVRYYRARHIEIASDPPIQGQLDGDVFRPTPIEIEVVPHALRVLVPEVSRVR